MKKNLLILSFFVTGSAIVFFSCRKQDLPGMLSEKKLAQDVFGVDYNTMPENELVKNVFFPSTVNNGAAALGRVLFYDTRLSLSGSVACASCHKQDIGFSDDVAFSMGFKGLGTSMNAPPISNLEKSFFFFWRARANSLEQLSLMPVENHIEMGFIDRNDVLKRLNSVPFYTENFKKVYNREFNETDVRDALSQFMRSLKSANSKYDQGYTNNAEFPFPNFTEEENYGKKLFFNDYNCGSCHGNVSTLTLGWGESFTNIGLDPYKDENDSMASFGFKVPSLRNVALTAPYMHDGRFNTLEEVIEHYSTGININPGLSWTLQDFNQETNELTAKKLNIPEADKKALIAFLNTLTDYSFLTDKRFSDPFRN